MEVESSEVEKLKMDSHRVRVMVLNMLRSTHIAEPHLFSMFPSILLIILT